MYNRSNNRPVVLTDADLVAMGALIDDDAPAGGPRRPDRADYGVVTTASIRRRAAWVG